MLRDRRTVQGRQLEQPQGAVMGLTVSARAVEVRARITAVLQAGYDGSTLNQSAPLPIADHLELRGNGGTIGAEGG